MILSRLQLGPLELVRVRKFKGKVYVDIRKYFEKNGELAPTQKGRKFSENSEN
jgi:hypothetical protein